MSTTPSRAADICSEWFDFETSGCNIQPPKLDELVIKYFGDGETIKFQPPILIDGKPSSTYYRLEYLGESPACDDGNCRGPHYCSKEVADEGVIWGDFCPYVHTGECEMRDVMERAALPILYMGGGNKGMSPFNHFSVKYPRICY
jgi:hypothetical protein